jgi:hypothetical protein
MKKKSGHGGTEGEEREETGEHLGAGESKSGLKKKKNRGWGQEEEEV